MFLDPKRAKTRRLLRSTPRYFIVPEMSGRLEAQFNPDANGAAWFVAEVIPSDTPNEEIDALNRIDTKRQAVADRRFTDRLPVTGTADTAASSRLTDYRVSRLTYEDDSATEGIAVFSEIYYDKGWKAYVDGTEAPYFRADYVLRAMTLPAGTHTVEWRFRAPGWTAVEGVTLAASLAILLGAVAALVYCFRKRTEKEK